VIAFHRRHRAREKTDPVLRSGREYLEGLRDGRVVYAGAERVSDIASHPAFGAAAETIAAVYDLKCAEPSDFAVDDGEGAPYSTYFHVPRSRGDLERRLRCHQRIADSTCGLLGRSPDHAASLVTGLAMGASALDTADGGRFSQNLLTYHRDARSRDAYIAYAVLPADRKSDEDTGGSRAAAGLRIVREDKDGVVVQGMKALATAAVIADEIWIGNLQALPSGAEAESLTFVVPCNTPGLELWARQPFSGHVFEDQPRPIAWRFDEGDALVVFKDVFVAWEHVFVHRDPVRSSEIYIRTPAHALANHQSSVRSRSKARLLAGLAKRLAGINGVTDVSAVGDVLGRLAALEATIAALVDAQVYGFETWPGGGVAPNRRYVYAALNWCQETLPAFIDALRELFGAGLFKLPPPVAFDDTDPLGASGDRGGLGSADALEQAQVLRLIWDFIGSEFAGRQQLYERFYAGPPFVVRGHNFREAPWDAMEEALTQLLGSLRD
jgi:4-hydroxyphenylacetate 3-monooxygenase